MLKTSGYRFYHSVPVGRSIAQDYATLYLSPPAGECPLGHIIAVNISQSRAHWVTMTTFGKPSFIPNCLIVVRPTHRV